MAPHIPPALGAPRGTRGAPRSHAATRGPEMAPPMLGAPREPVALLDPACAHRSLRGAPRWPPTPPISRTRPGAAVARLGLDTGCLIDAPPGGTRVAPPARARPPPAARARRAR